MSHWTVSPSILLTVPSRGCGLTLFRISFSQNALVSWLVLIGRLLVQLRGRSHGLVVFKAPAVEKPTADSTRLGSFSGTQAGRDPAEGGRIGK